jgi:hypothetical protein
VPSMEYAERASISANLPAEETPQEAQAIAKRSA